MTVQTNWDYFKSRRYNDSIEIQQIRVKRTYASTFYISNDDKPCPLPRQAATKKRVKKKKKTCNEKYVSRLNLCAKKGHRVRQLGPDRNIGRERRRFGRFTSMKD